MNKPLVSILLMEYKNFQYIFECIESIMRQDYPNIEMIINSDACDDFDETVLINYLRTHKSPNLQKIQINNNEYNIGTVRSCNQCVRMSSGKYFMLVAADDALYNDSVLSAYVDFYESVPENSAIAIGKALMMDEYLNNIIYTSPSDEDEPLMYSLDSKGLFNVFVQRFFFSTGNVLPRSYYDKYGGYDEEYRLIEDAPYYAKAMCRGTNLHYLGIPTYKHRGGGISHGNNRYSSEASRVYIKDSLTIFERDYLPNAKLLDFKAKRVVKARYVNLKRQYYKDYILPKQSIKEKLKTYFRHPWILILFPLLKYFISKTIAFPANTIKYLFCFGTVCLIIFQFSEWQSLLPQYFDPWLRIIIGYSGLIAIGLCALVFVLKYMLLIIFRILQKIRR